MTAPLPLLLLENNQADACLLIELLDEEQSQAWQVVHARSLRDALSHLKNTQFEVALLNLALPDAEGLHVIDQIRAIAPNLPLIVLSELDNQDLALQAVAHGAQDHLAKDRLNTDVLLRVIGYAIERGRIFRQLQAEVCERKRAEQTLRLIVEGTAPVIGEDFFRSLVRSLSEALGTRYALISGCIDTPPTRVCTFAFWQKCEFGENVEYDLYGTPCEQVFNGKGCQYYAEHVQTLFPEHRELVELEVQSYAGIPLFGSDGQVLGHLAVFDDKPLENEPRDTSLLEIFAARAAAEIERQQMSEALRFSQTKFSKAFRSSPSAITLSTFSEGRFIEVNDTCLRMLGYEREELIGCSVYELGIWANPQQRELLKQKLQAHKTVTNLEVELRKKSGETFLGLMSVEIIELEDGPCLLSVTTDITLIKQASKAMERLAEIGELASMIVHEIRNPLATLLMGINSFRRLELPERFQEYLTLSLNEGDRLQRLLNQILLYAKPQTLQRVEIELNQFIAETLIPLKTIPAAVDKLLTFTPVVTPIFVLADPDKLKQVIINLVTNAVEAIEPGDAVAIAVSADSTNYVCFEIHNGGAAIPAEVLPNLTKPFVTTKATGNGLGLAVVKRIVEAHGGTMAIVSSDEVGTTVRVRLLTSCTG